MKNKTNKELFKQAEEMRAAIAELQSCKEEQESVAGELRESEAKFRTLAEKSVVGIYLIQDDLLRYVNPKFAEIFGYEADEMINHLGATAIVFPEDRPWVEENIRRRISGEVESVHSQFRGVKKNEEVIQVEVYGSRIEHRGRPAVENTPDGGEIIISLTQHRSGTLLQVQDYGVGILPSDREFIFQGFHHTQETEEYSTKKPFDFEADGKGLELMRLKILSEEGAFDISFESSRRRYLPSHLDHCCGRISSCPYINDSEGCKRSGGTTFWVLFKRPRH